jgi:hypothetical protein
MLDAKFEELDEGSASVLGRFFGHYHGMVRFHAASSAGERVRAALLAPVAKSSSSGGGGSDDPWLRAQAARSPGGAAGAPLRLEALALAWALRQRGVTGSVVVGVSKPAHATANLATAAWAAAGAAPKKSRAALAK